MGRATNLNRTLGWIIILSTAYTALVILVLHILQPNKNPAVNAISEYVEGQYGFLMTTVFFVQSIGAIALAMMAARIRPKTRKVLIGSILFILAALGDTLAGLFPADPISATTMTSTGMIHTLGGLTRFLSLAIGLPLLSAVLMKQELWQEQGRLLKILGIAFVAIFLVTLFVLAPMELFGIGQRGFIAVVLTWMLVVGLPMTRTEIATH